MRERADQSIRAPGETPMYLELPELGVIPSADAAGSRQFAYYHEPAARDRGLGDGQQKPAAGGSGLGAGEPPSKSRDPSDGALLLGLAATGHAPRTAHHAHGTTNKRRDGNGRRPQRIELVTSAQSSSVLADSFRAAFASILYSGENGDRPRAIVLTSANPREGKTTVASNLALAAAEMGQSVLLIDGDLRKGRLHEVFQVPNAWGLSDLLAGKEPPEEQPTVDNRQSGVQGREASGSADPRLRAPRLVAEPRVIPSSPSVIPPPPSVIPSSPAVILSSPSVIPSFPSVILSEAKDPRSSEPPPYCHSERSAESRPGSSPQREAAGSSETQVPSPKLRGLVLATGCGYLYLLPAGSPAPNIPSLLYSPRASEFLARMRKEFHTIIIDSPPMLNMPDARILGRLADAVVLVVRSAQTSRETAAAATERLRHDGTRILGTILNEWDPRRSSHSAYAYGYPRYVKYE